jgi:hypothetical protein
MNIEKGRLKTATRLVLYGVAGIGKSTLAAALFPGRILFLDTEDSTLRMDVDRVRIRTYNELESALDQLARSCDYEAVAIDTIDWAELLGIQRMLTNDHKRSIEDYGYGKGFTKAAEVMKSLLEKCDTLVARGIHVVLIAHSKISRVSPPDETEGYDRYELKLSKHAAPLVKEWSDGLLFLKFGLQMVEGKDGKVKGTSTGTRTLHTQQSAAWDAKCRESLPESIQFVDTSEAVDALAPIFHGALPASAPVLQPPPQPQQPQKQPMPPAQADAAAAEMEELLQVIREHADNLPRVSAVVERALAHYGNPLDALSLEQLRVLRDRVLEEVAANDEEPQQAEHQEQTIPPVHAWFEANASRVNAYLEKLTLIKRGQTWRDVAPATMQKIEGDIARFAKNCGIPAPKL